MPVSVSGVPIVTVFGTPVISVTGMVGVVNAADELIGEARCVAVSALRWVNVYDVFGVNPVNDGDDCHVPPLILYSQPSTMVSVMLVDVLPSLAGAAGASWVAFTTADVPDEVTLPLQFAAVITTLI